jgi:hypothetical protein
MITQDQREALDFPTSRDQHKARIYFALCHAGENGLTDFELSHHLGIFLSSVNAARHWLKVNGQVKDSGIKRPSGRGGMATVWVIA